MRAVSGSSCAPFHLAADFTALAVYPRSSSLAAAATRSVSSVMYVFLIQSAVLERMERRKRSSLVLRTNSRADASFAGPAGAAGEELAGAAPPGPLEEDAQQRSRPARQGATTRMAAQTTRARGFCYVFGTTGPVSRICVSSSPARSAYSVRRREARRSLRHSSRLMFCRTSTYACTSVWYRR